MREDQPSPPPREATREERLAAKLRENLHRRKQQARAQGAQVLSKDGPTS
ncbi:MAG: hypothetical protein ACK4YM_01515 [Novosphingobium sp.]